MYMQNTFPNTEDFFPLENTKMENYLSLPFFTRFDFFLATPFLGYGLHHACGTTMLLVLRRDSFIIDKAVRVVGRLRFNAERSLHCAVQLLILALGSNLQVTTGLITIIVGLLLH
jgi:hypothetical protein